MQNHPAVSAWLIATMLFALIGSALDAQTAERKFPYQALVLGENASVHSGPGSVHYSTDNLKQNAVVEVYRHDPGGWCAIKPPAGSFSLIPESALNKFSDTIGNINEDGTQAWVGTRTGSVEKPLWQVKLRLGERVNILGEASWPHPDGHSTVWYQISPPAGEFRWIRISDLKLPKNVTDLPGNEPKTADKIRTNIGGDDLSASRTKLVSGVQISDPSFEISDDVFNLSEPSYDRSNEVTPEPPSENNLAINHGWRRAKTSVRVADSRGVPVSKDPFTTPAIAAPSTVDALSSNSDNSNLNLNLGKVDSVPSLDDATAGHSLEPITGPATERIRLLENSLSNEMLKSPNLWNLEPMLRQATSISINSNKIHERQHATRLIQKIRSCASIQSRFETAYNQPIAGGNVLTGQTLAGSGSRSGSGSKNQSNSANQNGSGSRVANQPAAQGTTAGSQLDSNVQFGTTYDAHGWLNQLVRSRGSLQPTYVLENDSGQITHHISPSPGLNLNRYLKNKIGVVGRRGFDRSLQLNHVTADRIVVIDQLRR